MEKGKFLEAIRSKIQENSILNHPFYVKWNEGKLSIEELRNYAKQYYKFVEHFPMFVSSVHSNCTDSRVRSLLLENLADEEGFRSGMQNHPKLWMNFCAALGIEENAVAEAKPANKIKNMVDGYYRYCRDTDYRIGLAALLAYEYQIPEVSRVKIEGLQKYYGIDSAAAIEFFTVHRTADIYHSETELNILLEKCAEESDRAMVLKTIVEATRLYWGMLDGMYIN